LKSLQKLVIIPRSHGLDLAWVCPWHSCPWSLLLSVAKGEDMNLYVLETRLGYHWRLPRTLVSCQACVLSLSPTPVTMVLSAMKSCSHREPFKNQHWALWNFNLENHKLNKFLFFMSPSLKFLSGYEKLSYHYHSSLKLKITSWSLWFSWEIRKAIQSNF
jgi:hypothetical protein